MKVYFQSEHFVNVSTGLIFSNTALLMLVVIGKFLNQPKLVNDTWMAKPGRISVCQWLLCCLNPAFDHATIVYMSKRHVHEQPRDLFEASQYGARSFLKQYKCSLFNKQNIHIQLKMVPSVEVALNFLCEQQSQQNT